MVKEAEGAANVKGIADEGEIGTDPFKLGRQVFDDRTEQTMSEVDNDEEENFGDFSEERPLVTASHGNEQNDHQDDNKVLLRFLQYLCILIWVAVSVFCTWAILIHIVRAVTAVGCVIAGTMLGLYLSYPVFLLYKFLASTCDRCFNATKSTRHPDDVIFCFAFPLWVFSALVTVVPLFFLDQESEPTLDYYVCLFVRGSFFGSIFTSFIVIGLLLCLLKTSACLVNASKRCWKAMCGKDREDAETHDEPKP